jgi:hypothetical protein
MEREATLQIEVGAWLCEMEGFYVAVRFEKGRKGAERLCPGPRAGFDPMCQSSTTSPIRRFGRRPRRRPRLP